MASVPGLYAPDSPMVTYLKDLPRLKPTLPHGQLVCVSATTNVTTTAGLMRLATAIGPYIAVLQIHADSISDWSSLSAQRLTNLAQNYGFLLWEGGRILNTQGRSGRKGAMSEEDIAESIEMARKRYLKGSVGVASWAGVGSTWAITSEDHAAAAGRMIPELRRAAREAVTSSSMSVRTEITANVATPESADSPDDGGVQQIVTVEETTTDDNGDGDDGTGSGDDIPGLLQDDSEMVSNLRKFSAISLTQTITQSEEVNTESSAGGSEAESPNQEYDAGSDDTANNEEEEASVAQPPPLFSRGIVLCIPTVYESQSKPAYKNTVIDSALQHGDFVLGFNTDEAWGDMCYRERTEIMTWAENYGEYSEVAKWSSERGEQNFAADWTPGVTKCFVTFAPLARDCVAHAGDELGEQAAGRPVPQIFASSLDGKQRPWSSGPYARQIDALHDIVARAAAVRETTFPTKGVVSYKEGADMMYIPVVSMEA